MSGPSRLPPKDAEKERLAKALRDNLKRRKAQVRGRAAGPDAERNSGVDSQAEGALHTDEAQG